MFRFVLLAAAAATGLLPDGDDPGPGHPEGRVYRPPAVSMGSPAEPLTGPAPGTAVQRALWFLRQQREPFALTQADVENVVVTGETASAHAGVSHVFLRQHVDGIEVVGTEANVSVAADGRVLALRHSFFPGLARAVERREPEIGAPEAAETAARHLGLEPRSPFAILGQGCDPGQRTRLSGGGIASDDIHARLVYQPLGPEQVALAWQLELAQQGAPHLWQFTIDALSGAVLDLRDLTSHLD